MVRAPRGEEARCGNLYSATKLLPLSGHAVREGKNRQAKEEKSRVVGSHVASGAAGGAQLVRKAGNDGVWGTPSPPTGDADLCRIQRPSRREISLTRLPVFVYYSPVGKN